jgi:hypothetical protein
MREKPHVPSSAVPGMRASNFAPGDPPPCGHLETQPGCVLCAEYDALFEGEAIVEVTSHKGIRGSVFVKTGEGRRYEILAKDVPERAYPQLGRMISSYKARELP